MNKTTERIKCRWCPAQLKKKYVRSHEMSLHARKLAEEMEKSIK